MLCKSASKLSAPLQTAVAVLLRQNYVTAAAPGDALQPWVPPWVDVLLPAAAATTHLAQVKGPRLLSRYYYSVQQLPPPRWPEVAVLGRSNVGKSSLVNALLGGSSSSSSSSGGSSGLAKVSGTPGRTSSINLYQVNPSLVLADCPGYGYAKTSEAARADWHAMTQAYLKQRSKAGLLVDVLLLIDASLPPRDMDLAGVEWLVSRKLPLTLVYTKCDKHKKGEPGPADNIAAFREALEQRKLLQPAQFPTSSSAAGKGSSGSSRGGRFGQRELLQYLARRVGAHKAASQQQPLAAAAAVVGS